MIWVSLAILPEPPVAKLPAVRPIQFDGRLGGVAAILLVSSEQVLANYCWRPVVQTAVRAFGILFLPPAFDLSLRIRQMQEPICIEALVPESSIEALCVTVLHRFPRLDMANRNP